MDDNTVISLENVSVKYRVPQERIGTFREYLIRLIQNKISFRSFFALENINLAIKNGEVFGIIGDNGAGKSTLLKVISRILHPIQGRVIVRGRVAPLLELGAGFHPELTGRENIYLNGALLGYSQTEMDEVVPQILSFSELEGFIDAPLRTYSSGMNARLGFAVATAYEPEVLIVDEILSVGDEPFQQKCAERISLFREHGTSIVIVSHSLSKLESLCQRIAWLEHGNIIMVGEPASVIHAYRMRKDD